jgi:titin
VKAGDGNATLIWSPPENQGGKPILGYRIYRITLDPISRETMVASYVQDQTYTVKGLTNGREIKLKVCAENEVGIGPGIEVSATPLGRPSSPMNLFADPLEAAIRLSWSRPLDDGGSRIIGYVVWKGSSRTDLRPLVTLGNLTSYIDGDVKAGEVYYYSVQAINVIGNGSSPDPIEVRFSSGGLTGLGIGGSLVIVLLIAAVSIAIIAWYVRRTRMESDKP